MSTDRVNRLALFIVGLVLSGAGAAGLALGTGRAGEGLAGERIPDTLVGLYPPTAPAWVPAIVALAALLLAYLALRWIGAQLRLPPAVRSIELEHEGRGRTEIRGSALEHAISADLERLPGATDARVRLLVDGSRPSLAIRLEFAERADVSELLRLAGKALPAAARLAGMQELEASVRLVPVEPKRVQ